MAMQIFAYHHIFPLFFQLQRRVTFHYDNFVQFFIPFFRLDKKHRKRKVCYILTIFSLLFINAERIVDCTPYARHTVVTHGTNVADFLYNLTSDYAYSGAGEVEIRTSYRKTFSTAINQRTKWTRVIDSLSNINGNVFRRLEIFFRFCTKASLSFNCSLSSVPCFLTIPSS